jgi:glycosyltransferase involved in cell wall biosynthesis
MKLKQRNAFVRRVLNLPSTIGNVSRVIWHPIRNLCFVIWHPVRTICHVIWHPIRNLCFIIWKPLALVLNRFWGPVSKWGLTQAIVSKFRHVHILTKLREKLRRQAIGVEPIEGSLLILLACIPAGILFAFKNTFLGRTYLSSLMPKLGVFHQHEPREWSHRYTKVLFQSNHDYPKITIVTPSYGQAEFISRTMDSVLQQGYPSLDYWVQDGGSSDGTVDILEKYSEQLTGWQSAPDDGQTHALNLAIQNIEPGEIMAYLNSDDLLVPGAFARIVDFFQTNPEVDVVYGNRLMIDENDMCIGEWILHGHDSEVLSYADYIPQETMFWRRSIWQDVGEKFDESYKFAMDWDLLLRFRNAGARFAHIPNFLGAFRIHSSQKTQAMINEVGEAEMARLRKRELGFVPRDVDIYSNILPFLLRHTIADFKLRYIDKSL